MSKLKISEDMFLGQVELERMIKFLDEDGYRKHIILETEEFGIVRNDRTDPQFSNFRIDVSPAPEAVELLTESVAISSEGIIRAKPRSIHMPLGTRYIYVKHAFTSEEEGTVDIHQDGTLVGSGTKFTEVFRGMPDHPNRVIFPNSTHNTSPYQIVEVLDDEHAVAMGTFTAESGISYSVGGTFTSGFMPSAANAEVFLNDTASIFVSLYSFPDSDSVFQIAKVVTTTSSVTVEDRRSSVWKMRGDMKSERLATGVNALFGVYGIRWADLHSSRDRNIMVIDWGFSSDNWTFNGSARLLTVNGGEGGRFKDTTYFSDGDFDGWRVYFSNGTYGKITSSIKSGSQINLYLDELDSTNTASSGLLSIVPDAEEIMISIKSGSQYPDNPNVEESYVSFPIASAQGEVDIVVPDTSSWKFCLSYKYRNGWSYSREMLPLSDQVGFYEESSFDGDSSGTNPTPDGVLNSSPADRSRKPYSVLSNCEGYIELIAHPDSYYNLISRVYKGDKVGVKHWIVGNSASVTTLVVGQSERVQVVTGSPVLTVDIAINLSKLGAVNGNEFLILVRATPLLSGNKFQVVTDFTSFGQAYTVLYDIKDSDLSKVDSNGGLVIRAVYDDNGEWTIFGVNEIEAGFGGAWDRLSKIDTQRSDGSDGLLSSNIYES